MVPIGFGLDRIRIERLRVFASPDASGDRNGRNLGRSQRRSGFS